MATNAEGTWRITDEPKTDFKAGDTVLFGECVWVISKIVEPDGKFIYIRPPRQEDILTTPRFSIKDGKFYLEGNHEPLLPADEPQAPPARKRARKQQPGEQLSLFSGVGEGVGL